MYAIINMDVINEIEVIEKDVHVCGDKCEMNGCTAIYNAIVSTLKLYNNKITF